jgi:citrate/tricarballylate utilization protein
MGELDALVREATALAQGAPASGTAESEAARQLQICNACRYCESFCAVFPAMTRRLAFPAADVHYLANLCHNCGACLHACQYAPPHEFGVNIPRAMAQVRVRTYEDYAWPRAFGALYRRNGMAVAMALVVAIAAFLMASAARTDAPANANFYAVFSHGTMATLFGAAFLWAVLALGIGAARFWRGQHPGAASGPAMAEAAKNALTLTYLDGGHGEGCNESSDRFTLARRHFHHATFYGFLLCFASTCVATLYHYALGLHAPYAITSLPVVLGTLGGIGLVVGPAGLLVLNLRRHPQHGDPKQRPMDRAFILLLLLVSFTGLALLAWRGTAAMPVLLAAHLGTVMALFLTLPYGKFAHAVYRCAALLKHTIEKRQPSRLALGSD